MLMVVYSVGHVVVMGMSTLCAVMRTSLEITIHNESQIFVRILTALM